MSRYTVLLLLIVLGCVYPVSSTLPEKIEDYFVGDGDILSNLPARCDSLKSELDSTWCRTAPKCAPDSVALSFLVPQRVDVVGTATVTTTYVHDNSIPAHLFTATGFVLSASQGGPGGIRRGQIYIPENNVDGGAYAPIASRVARAGHVALILDTITGLTDDDVIMHVERAIASRPDVGIWVLAGHGRGGNIAALIASHDKVNRFRGLVLYGAAPLDLNFANANLGIFFAYGGADTITAPANARTFLSTNVPPDAWALYFATAQHLDFAYSTCLGNSFTPGTGMCDPLRFTSAAVPVLGMPNANTGSKVMVNVNDAITTTGLVSGPATVLGDKCKDEFSEYSFDRGLTWNTAIATRDLNDYLYATGSGPSTLRVEARTDRNHYSEAVTALQGALVRAHFTCDRISETGCVEFFVHNNASGIAEVRSAAVSLQSAGSTAPGTDTLAINIMAVGAWRAPSERAMSFFNNDALSPIGAYPYSKFYPSDAVGPIMTETLVIAPAPTSNTPISRRWYVFRPIDTNLVKGGLIYMTGGAVDVRSYAPLAFEFATRGYLVVLIAATARSAIQDATGPFAVPNSVMAHPSFAFLAGRWAIGGHSLGGVAAATYTAGNSNTTFSKVKAVILHAGAVGAPLGNFPPHVVQIYGSLDNILSVRVLAGFPSTNPARTRNIAVNGGNHYQVGDYGYQAPDNVALISQDEQQRTTALESITTMVNAGLV